MKTKSQGFTLIELMIVVAIIGILAAVAVPQYQNYTIRAKMSEALSLLSSAKTAFSEYYTSEGTVGSLASMGITTTIANSDIVSSITISNSRSLGAVLKAFGGTVTAGDKLTLAASISTSGITWTCSATGVDSAYLPANCR